MENETLEKQPQHSQESKKLDEEGEDSVQAQVQAPAGTQHQSQEIKVSDGKKKDDGDGASVSSSSSSSSSSSGSESSSSADAGNRPDKGKKGKVKGNVFLEDQAEESDDGGGGGKDDDDDDGKAKNDYEYDDGFLVKDDEVEESDRSSGGDESDDDEEGGEGRKRKKGRKFRKKKKVPKLDKDDLDLVFENQEGIDGDVVVGSGAAPGALVDDGPGYGIGPEDENSEYDSEDSFIAGRKRKKKTRVGDINSALAEADDKIGRLFGFMEGEFDVQLKDAQNDGEYEFEDTTLKDQEKERRRKMEDTFDFTSRAQNYMLEEDELIRKIDLPERIQLRERSLNLKRGPNGGEHFLHFALDSDVNEQRIAPNDGFGVDMLMGAPASVGSSENQNKDFQRMQQAKWVTTRLVEHLQRRVRHTVTLEVSDLTEPVKHALRFMQQRFLEVPTIYLYHGALINPLTLDDLWEIQDLSFSYLDVLSRKKQLLMLIEKVVPDDMIDPATISSAELATSQSTMQIDDGVALGKSFQESLRERVRSLNLQDLTLQMLNDIHNFVRTMFGDLTREINAALPKRKKKSKRKSQAQNNGGSGVGSATKKNDSIDEIDDEEINNLFKVDDEEEDSSQEKDGSREIDEKEKESETAVDEAKQAEGPNPAQNGQEGGYEEPSTRAAPLEEVKKVEEGEITEAVEGIGSHEESNLQVDSQETTHLSSQGVAATSTATETSEVSHPANMDTNALKGATPSGIDCEVSAMDMDISEQEEAKTDGNREEVSSKSRIIKETEDTGEQNQAMEIDEEEKDGEKNDAQRGEENDDDEDYDEGDDDEVIELDPKMLRGSQDEFVIAKQREVAAALDKKKRERMKKQKKRMVRRRNATGQGRVKQKAILGLTAFCDVIGSSSRLGASVAEGQVLWKISNEAVMVEPDIIAMNCVGPDLRDEEMVKGAAIKVMAREFASEPRVVKKLREIAREYGKVSTRLTGKGRSIVAADPFHDYYEVACLVSKPFHLLAYGEQAEVEADMPMEANPAMISPKAVDHQAQTLLILKAESEGILRKGVNETELKYQVLRFFADFILADEAARDIKDGMRLGDSPQGEGKSQELELPHDDVFAGWDEVRYHTLVQASEHMVEIMEQFIFEELASLARKHVLRLIAKSLWEEVTIAPLTFPFEHLSIKIPRDRRLTSAGARVMGVYLTDQHREKSFAAVLDHNGSWTKYAELPSLVRRVEVEQALNALIERECPHFVICNSSSGMRMRGILRGLELKAEERVLHAEKIEDLQMSDDLEGATREEITEANHSRLFVPLVIDDGIAMSVAGGRLRRHEFADFDQNLVRAICLARFVQSPLQEVCALWTDISRGDISKPEESEILALDLHLLQSTVPSISRLRMLERVLVSAASLQGVNFGHAVLHEHARTIVPFLPGLGFRKAKALLTAMQRLPRGRIRRLAIRRWLRANSVANASQVTNMLDDEDSDDMNTTNGSGRTGFVFENLAGFVRIVDSHAILPFHRDDEFEDDDEIVANCLDATRIHPIYDEQLACMIVWFARKGADTQMPDMEGDGELDASVAREIQRLMDKSSQKLRDLLSVEGNEAFLQKHGNSHWVAFPDDPNQIASVHSVPRKLFPVEEDPDLHKVLDIGDDVSSIDLSMLTITVQTTFGTRFRNELHARSAVGNVCRELQIPCAPCFRMRTQLSDEELFDLLAGNKDGSISPGNDVSVKLTAIKGSFLDVMLPSGVRGSIHIRQMSDMQAPFVNLHNPSMQELLAVKEFIKRDCNLEIGATFAARIMNVKKGRFAVDLIAKPSVLQRRVELIFKDRFWRRPQTREERQRKKPSSNRTTDGKLKRPITHPAFQNVSISEAEAFLADKPVGEYVVRPSSKGLQFVSITWKVSDGPPPMFQNVQVQESPEKGRFDAKLVPPLTIRRNNGADMYEFEDLDELLTTYIEPMAEFVKEMEKFRKFRNRTDSQIADECGAQKASNPETIPYFVNRIPDHPGYFKLHFQPGTSVKKLKVGVYPNGFRVGDDKKEFNSVESMVTWFKANFQTLLSRQAQRGVNRYGAGGRGGSRNNFYSTAPSYGAYSGYGYGGSGAYGGGGGSGGYQFYGR